MFTTLLLSLSLLAAAPSPALDMGPPPQDAGVDEPVAARKDKAAAKDAAKEDKMSEKKQGPQSGMNGAAASVKTFAEAVEKGRKDPHVVADLFLQALAAYTLDRDIGLPMLAMLLPDDDVMLDDGVKVPNRFRQDELLQLDKKPNIMQGYCGGTPAKGYKDADVPNCTAKFDTEYSKTRQGIGYPTADRAKFFITNGGSSRPRPIELEHDADGNWRINKYGLLSGVASAAE